MTLCPEDPARRTLLVSAAGLALATATGSLPASATPPAGTAAGSPRDFDFFHGDWRVRHRRLRARLVGSADWDAFDGTCRVWPLLGGAGNVDDNTLDLPGGAYRAVTLRSFDPATGLWSIWWLDGRWPHRLDVPMVGRFTDGEGIFLADDTFDGRPIHVRFLWRSRGKTGPRWEQAFSADGGATWETNWTMDFLRAST